MDRYTFIADERFQAWHEPATETWTLQVKYVQARDEGRYECQVSTEPKMSHFVYFTVVSEWFLLLFWRGWLGVNQRGILIWQPSRSVSNGSFSLIHETFRVLVYF